MGIAWSLSNLRLQKAAYGASVCLVQASIWQREIKIGRGRGSERWTAARSNWSLGTTQTMRSQNKATRIKPRSTFYTQTRILVSGLK